VCVWRELIDIVYSYDKAFTSNKLNFRAEWVTWHCGIGL